MNEGTECETVLPRIVEVLHIDIIVWRSFALAPQK